MIKILIISSLLIHAYFRLTVEVKDQHEVESIIQKVHEYPKETTIGIFAAGKIPYYCPEYRFLDFLGKSDRYIARTEPHPGAMIGHNKFDFNYSIGQLKPDLIITANNFHDISDYQKYFKSRGVETTLDEMAAEMLRQDYKWKLSPALYLDTNFRQNYEYKYGSYYLIYERK